MDDGLQLMDIDRFLSFVSIYNSFVKKLDWEKIIDLAD